MALEKLKKQLETTGLPVTYRAWPEGKAPAMPYVCYLSNGTNTLFADGQVYYSYDNVRVELYTPQKCPEAERAVETALTGYHWSKNENYLDTERCQMTTYDIDV